MKRSILVADDDGACLTICAEALAKSGYVVHSAHDGVRALRLAAERRPDLILTDFYLPVMDGGELIRRLRHGGIAIPVIMMSGSSDGQVQAFRNHAEAFLAKPFRAQVALDAVERVLTRDA